ncbi:MAG: LysM peptidoglycan-binding domain-containing protein [Firmicutes bacterium]|nr:LysM peptidoglycan-binding domain-containing protein [Bacillota bacterium]
MFTIVKKRKPYLQLLIIPLVVAILGFVDVHAGYAVYASDNHVGVIKKTEKVQQALDQLLKEKSTEMGQEVFVDTSIDYKRVWLNGNELTDVTDIKEKLEQELTFKTSATAVYVNGKKEFLLANQSDAKKLINTIKDQYTEGTEKKTEIIEQIDFEDVEALVDEVQTVKNSLEKVLQGSKSTTFYTVKSGDTLSGIASKHNVTLEQIQELNPEVNGLIKIGQKIDINKAKPLINVQSSYTKEENKVIPFKAIVNKTAKLALGESKLAQQGRNGEKTLEYEIIKINGVKTSTKVVKETVIKQPVNKITETGNGKLLKPTSGYVSSEFGHRWGRSHNGIDIANNYGAGVYAAAAGKVIRAGWGSGYGKIIAIQHSDGKITRYAHLSSMSVSYGTWVERGELIGKVGTSGRTTGPNLHFEVILNEDFKDPQRYI